MRIRVCLRVMVCTWYMVEYKVINVDLNRTVETRSTGLRQSLHYVMWFGLLKHGALDRPAGFWEAPRSSEPMKEQ